MWLFLGTHLLWWWWWRVAVVEAVGTVAAVPVAAVMAVATGLVVAVEVVARLRPRGLLLVTEEEADATASPTIACFL